MTREKYLELRNKNNIEPMYEYYKENHKGGIFLTLQEFFACMFQWPHIMETFEKFIGYYDKKFEVITVSNVKTGQILKYI